MGFNDPNNRLKGGNADITIDNPKKLVSRARSTKVVLKVKFDSGVSPKDGLFSMSVDYELHHDGLVEVGSFSVNRQKVDGKWATQIESKKTSAKNAKDIIPGFSLAMKSDYKTSANGVVSCSAGNKYSINHMDAITMFFDVEGENPRMGKYHINRDVKMSSKGDVLEASWTGTTSVANAPFPSPVDTRVSANMNMATNDYKIDLTKTIAGTNYGVTLKNGRLAVNL